MDSSTHAVLAGRFSWLRGVVFWTGVVGATLFGAALVASFVNPLFVEALARNVVRMEVEKRVGESLDESRLVALAERTLRRHSEEIAEARQALREGVPRKVAEVAGEMLKADCACRQKIETSVSESLLGRIAEKTRLDDRLSALVRTKYREVAASLTREFRIFTGANAFVFSLLVVTARLRKEAGLQLVLPTFVLVGAAAIVGSLYLFGQDWLHTILFGDYVGFAYFAYLGAAAALLADVLFNKALVSRTIVEGALHAVGAVSPC